MHDAFRHHRALPWIERDGLGIFDFNDELAFDHIEELILVVMLVPVEISVDDTESDHAIIDIDEALVPPGLDAVCERLDVHVFERSEFGVEMDLVGSLSHVKNGTGLPKRLLGLGVPGPELLKALNGQASAE